MKTIQLQSVGHVPAQEAIEIKVGDMLMWNFASTTIVTHVFEKTAKTITVVEYCTDSKKYYFRDFRKTRLVAIVKRGQDISNLNPTEAYCTKKKAFLPIPVTEVTNEIVVKKVEKVKAVTEVIEVIEEEKEQIEEIKCEYDENGFIVLSNEDAGELEKRFVYDKATKKEEELLRKYHLELQDRAMKYKSSLPANYEELINDDQVYEVISTFPADGGTAGIYNIEITGTELKSNLWTGVYILDIITPLNIQTAQEVTEEEIESESKETNNNIKINLNNELNGIEIHFHDKPSQEIIEQLKINKFRWSKRGFWYAKQNENTISFGNSLIDGNSDNSNIADSQPVSYPEIEINDIESYTVDQSLQDREHDSSWIFRKDKRDRTAEIQSIFTDYNNQVLAVLETTDNERIKYYLKKNLQSFKKKYFDNYVKMLSHRASNPSWAVTGRGGMNVSRYNKMQDRYDKLMGESVELTSWIDSQIKKAKSDIRRDKEQQIKKQIEVGLNNTEFNPTFTTQTKEVTVANYTSKVRTYNYQDYMIAKSWGCFRIFYNNKEIHSMKTTESLQDAKKYVCYLVSQDNQKAI